jgi:hypothetical protein
MFERLSTIRSLATAMPMSPLRAPNDQARVVMADCSPSARVSASMEMPPSGPASADRPRAAKMSVSPLNRKLAQFSRTSCARTLTSPVRPVPWL